MRNLLWEAVIENGVECQSVMEASRSNRDAARAARGDDTDHPPEPVYQ